MRSIAEACREARIDPLAREVIFLMEADEDQSHDDIRDALRDALKAELPVGPGYWVWVVEVWDMEFVYEFETPEGTRLFSRGYSIDDDGVATLGEQVEVERVTEFVPVGESLREAKAKTEDGKKFPASDYAYVPDADKPSTWKLRLTSTPGGAPDSGIVGAAAAALGKGFRGQKVKIPAADLPAVKKKVRAAWKKANPDKEADDMPAGIKESIEGTEYTGQIIPLIETSVRPDNTIPIKLIAPGWGSSAYYPAEVLKRDGPKVFTKGTHMNWDHQTEAEALEQPEGELNDLAGALECDAHWEPNHPNGPGLYADAEVFGPFDEKLEDLAPHIGTSINTSGLAESGEAEGREGFILTELLKTPFTSVDYVTMAGAGGEIVQLFESARPKKQGVSPMETAELKEVQDKLAIAVVENEELKVAAAAGEADKVELSRLREAKLETDATDLVTETIKDIEMPDVTRKRVIREAAKNPPVKDGELDAEALQKKAREVATEEAEYRENLGVGTVRGMGPSGDDEKNGRVKLEEAWRHKHPEWTDAQIAAAVDG